MAAATPAGATTLWSDHESLATDAEGMAGGGLLSDKVNAARVALARLSCAVDTVSMHTLELCVCYTRIKPYRKVKRVESVRSALLCGDTSNFR